MIWGYKYSIGQSMINSTTQGISLPRLIESQNAIIVHNIFIVSIDCAMDHHIQQPNNNYFSNAQLLLQYESVCVCNILLRLLQHVLPFFTFSLLINTIKMVDKNIFSIVLIIFVYLRNISYFQYGYSYQYIKQIFISWPHKLY